MLTELKKRVLRGAPKKVYEYPINFFQRGRTREAPIYLCCYHKCGTVLLTKVFRQICIENGWKFRRVYGQCSSIPDDIDVVLFEHSLLDLEAVTTPYLGAHLIRDPRDVIVSGYLYHKRCDETWCIADNHDPTPPIAYPNVPLPIQHRSETYKQSYIRSLNGKTYQQNLCDLNQSDGILFEMQHYSAYTIDCMIDWNYQNPNIAELRFESIMGEYDQMFEKLFRHLGFEGDRLTAAMEIAAEHDLGRMSAQELDANEHVSSRQITQKWKKYFSDEHKAAFTERFGDALVRLGYEDSTDW